MSPLHRGGGSISSLTSTHWFATLQLNAVRVVSAAVTLTILFVIGRLSGILAGPEWANTPVAAVLLMPPMLLVIGLAGILTFRSAGSIGVPMMGGPEFLLSLMMIAFIAVGDPLVWLIRRRFPGVVPARDWYVINPRALILVQREG